MARIPPKRLRLFLDTTILIKAASFPRLPFEILRLGLRGEAGIVLSAPVLLSARLRIMQLYPNQIAPFERILERTGYEEVAIPSLESVRTNRGLCRDESDVPIALAAIDSGVDYLVTNDRDLTVVDATTTRLREQVNVITPLAFLRHIMGWPEERIEAAIHRSWHELSAEDWRELSGGS